MTQNQIKSLIDATKTMIANSKKMRNGRVKSFSNEINNNITALTKVLPAQEVASCLNISRSAITKRMCSSKKMRDNKKNGIFMEITPSQDQNCSVKTSFPINSHLVADTIAGGDNKHRKYPIMEFTTKSGTKIVIFE